MPPELAREVIPLTLAGIPLDIVDGVAGSGVALGIASGLELGAESLVVLLVGSLVEDNALLVVGDLEDDELGLVALVIAAHAEGVECGKAFIVDGDTACHQYMVWVGWVGLGLRMGSRESGEAADDVPRCELYTNKRQYAPITTSRKIQRGKVQRTDMIAKDSRGQMDGER